MKIQTSIQLDGNLVFQNTGQYVDLIKGELRNARIQNLTADPGSPVEGQIYAHTTTHVLMGHNGTEFRQVGYLTKTSGGTNPGAMTAGGTASVGSSVDAARADHSHALASNTAGSTIVIGATGGVGSSSEPARADHTHGAPANATTGTSGFMSSTDKTKLDNATATNTNSTLALRDGAGRMQATDPSAAQDVATKNYVDNIALGLDAKNGVVCATTGNITLAGSAPNVVDGVTLAANDRILVKSQTTVAQNGIYYVSTLGTGANGTWTRATDNDSWAELISSYVWVEKGTTLADTGWLCTVDSGGTIGTTDVTWVQFSGAGQIAAGAGLTKTGNTIDVATASATRIVVNADNIDLATVTQGAGASFVKITLDSYGRVTGNTAVAAGDIPDISATYSLKAGNTGLTTTGTVTTGTWSGLFGAVSGANLTNLTAGNLSGTIPTGVLGNSTHYVGTTAIALNRASAAQALTGITSIDGSAATLTTTRTLWGQNFNGSAAVSGNLTSVGNITGTAGMDILTTTTGVLNLDSGSTGAVNLGTNANAKTVTIGNATGATAVVMNSGTGGITFNQVAGGLFKIQASASPTQDQVTITNTGFPVVTAGISGLQQTFVGGAAAVEASAQRVDLTPGTTAGGTWNANRIVPSVNTVAQTVNGIKFDTHTAPSGGGTDNALWVGTGWTNILNYNGTVVINGSGQLIAGQLSGTIPTGVLGSSTHYVGTTAIALNRGSAAQGLTGITSVDNGAAGDATALFSTVTTGSIAIGAGLTTGALNIAAVGTGATPINVGHTNAITTITGTVKLPTVANSTAGIVSIAADGTLSRTAVPGSITTKQSATIGAITGGTPLTITMGASFSDLTYSVQIYITSTGEIVYADVIKTAVNTFTVGVTTTQAAAYYSYTAIG